MTDGASLTKLPDDGRENPRKPVNDQERNELLRVAERAVNGPIAWNHFLETGKRLHETLGGGTWNGLQSAQECWYTSKWVSLYLPSESELKSAQRWHDHCDKHGYPFAGVSTKGYPPHPERSGAGEWIGLTWKQIHELATADQMQMELP